VTIASDFAPLLADPAGALVACDYDGTLAPIVADPERAWPAAGAVEALTVLSGRVGQVAVVTGRAALDAVRVGGLDRVPGLVVLGLYGGELWRAGVLDAPAPAPGLAAATTAAAELLRSGDPGVRLESKGGSFAVHTRQAADPGAELDRLRGPLGRIASDHGLQVEPGRYVLELRPRGPDKGVAVIRLAAELPASSVMYLGDDLGDLPAFDAIRQLRSRGVSAWAVAVDSDEAPEVAQAADLVVDSPAGVVRLLEELGQLLG
jgi:trehalose 6-phosphate phosphatase